MTTNILTCLRSDGVEYAQSLLMLMIHMYNIIFILHPCQASKVKHRQVEDSKLNVRTAAGV